MANLFGTAGADSITATGSVGFGGAVLGTAPPDIVFGNDGADSIIGSTANLNVALYFGGAGDDSIMGNGGFGTRLSGDDGNDTLDSSLAPPAQELFGGFGNDLLIGTISNDTADGGSDNDTILGNGGFDRLFGGGGADSIAGGLGDDLIEGGSGANTLSGDEGQDTILGGFEGDLIQGGAGLDFLTGGEGNNTILGGADSDRIVGGGGNDSIDGGDFGDHIDAGNGANTINGGTGDDRIFAGFGDDSIIGGANDTTDGGEYIDAHRGNNTVLGGGGGDVIMASSGNDRIEGQDGDDRIDGGDGNNTLLGGLGNDNIFAGLGADSVEGGDGNDVVYAGGGTDIVLGGAGHDSLNGGDSNDRLDGGAGNDRIGGDNGTDTIFGSSGSDFLDGGGDSDSLDYSFFGPGYSVTVSLSFTRVVKRDAGGVIGVDTISGFENFIGTAGNDRFIGWGQDDTFTSSAGNDTFDGGDGSDLVRYDVTNPLLTDVIVDLAAGFAIDGIGGTDRFRRTSATNSTVENIFTGIGFDTLLGDDDGNTFRGGLGEDSLDGRGGFDTIDYLVSGVVNGVKVDFTTGMATDSDGSIDLFVNFENARGTDLADTLIGTDGDNSFRARRGNDLISGGLDLDLTDHREDTDLNADGFGVIVNLSNGAVTIAGFGAETNVAVGAQRGRDGWGDTDTLVSIEAARGTNFNDVLIGTERVASFRAAGLTYYSTDRSQLHGRVGNDTLMAVATTDGVIASYSDDVSGIVARLDLGNTIIDGFGTIDTLVNIQNVQGSDYDDLIMAGNSGSWMRGRAGFDTMIGGTGFDSINYATSTAAVLVNLLAGTADDGLGYADSISGFEFVTTSRFADTIIGDNDGNWFFGNAGADSLVGGIGEDWVHYYGPWIGESSSVHVGVFVNLGNQTARDGDGSSASGSLDRLVSIEHAAGTHTADTLIGSGGANSLVGAEGNDSINGGGGDDVLVGGAGADTINGSSGLDTAAYEGSAVGVKVSLALAVQVSAGDANGDRFIAIENAMGSGFADTLSGDGGGNLLSGGAGNDSLAGANGNDTLAGDAGTDGLNGGNGADAFRFTSPLDHSTGATGRDRVVDFDGGTDRVEVVGSAFGGLPAGVLAAGRFVSGAGAVAADADDNFIFNTTNKVLSYDADGNGAGAAVQLALMVNLVAMANTDILVI